MIGWHKAGRYYQAAVQRDLFGDWQLVRYWGRIGSPLGGMKIDLTIDEADAQKRLERLERARTRRGYQPAQVSEK